jgi:hypothetical protein
LGFFQQSLQKELLCLYFVILTPSQIQYGGFERARMKKSGDMIRDQVRILYLLFLWVQLKIMNYLHPARWLEQVTRPEAIIMEKCI